jgi:hypothetical protein
MIQANSDKNFAMGIVNGDEGPVISVCTMQNLFLLS